MPRERRRMTHTRTTVVYMDMRALLQAYCERGRAQTEEFLMDRCTGSGEVDVDPSLVTIVVAIDVVDTSDSRDGALTVDLNCPETSCKGHAQSDLKAAGTSVGSKQDGGTDPLSPV